MATKANPGAFDCYANAEPDEPLFTVLARDRVGGDLVRVWVVLRACGEDGELRRMLDDIARVVEQADDDVLASMAGDAGEVAQLREALDCACAMDEWRSLNR